LNQAFSVTLDRSPNEVIMGFCLLAVVDVLNPDPKPLTFEQLQAVRELYAQEAKTLVMLGVAAIKIRYDKKYDPKTFQVGDERVGPFKVLSKIGQLAYKLNFPSNWKVHPVVSIA
ncbi:hypothetical protein LY78DRAFT_593655, partial [Colletotrichum sublineola]